MTKKELEQWEQYKEELSEKNEKVMQEFRDCIKENRKKIEELKSRNKDWYKSSVFGMSEYDSLLMIGDEIYSFILSSVKNPTIEGFYDWLSEKDKSLK